MTLTRYSREEITRTMQRLGGHDAEACVSALHAGDYALAARYAESVSDAAAARDDDDDAELAHWCASELTEAAKKSLTFEPAGLY